MSELLSPAQQLDVYIKQAVADNDVTKLERVEAIIEWKLLDLDYVNRVVLIASDYGADRATTWFIDNWKRAAYGHNVSQYIPYLDMLNSTQVYDEVLLYLYRTLGLITEVILDHVLESKTTVYTLALKRVIEILAPSYETVHVYYQRARQYDGNYEMEVILGDHLIKLEATAPLPAWLNDQRPIPSADELIPKEAWRTPQLRQSDFTVDNGQRQVKLLTIELADESVEAALFAALGPANPPASDEADELEWGGERMLISHRYDGDDDGVIQDWFLGHCQFCRKPIEQRWYAVREPQIFGGWLGCYCSWKCVRGNVNRLKPMEEYDPLQGELIDYFESLLSKRKIREREPTDRWYLWVESEIKRYSR